MKSKPLPVTTTPEKSHSDQYKWQILLPILVTVLVCVVVCLFLLLSNKSNPGSTRLWSDISIIFLAFNSILFGLLVYLLISLLSKLFKRWNQNLPAPLRNLRNKTLIFNQKVQNAAQPPAKTVIGIKGFITGVKTLFQGKLKV